MKLGRIARAGPDGSEPRLVAVLPERAVVCDLATAERQRLEAEGAARAAAARIARALFPSSMAAAIGGGTAFRSAAERALASATEDAYIRWELAEWVAPLDPPVARDCAAFERHLQNAHARGKKPVPEFFYHAPVYYKMNPFTFLGPEAEIPWPGGSKYLDYELELGLVIGGDGRDLVPEEASGLLFGVTILNDFSARDVQAREMSTGFGPAKGKDFASSVGPWIATADELDPANLDMVARVNGEEWSRGSSSSMMWSIPEIIAFASQNEVVLPGELIGSGTVGFGSGLELYKRLEPGDVVELEITGLGVLRNRIGARADARWRPEPKQPTDEEDRGGGESVE